MARNHQEGMQEAKRRELAEFVKKIRVEDKYLKGCVDKAWKGGKFSTIEREEFYHSRLRRASLEIKRREFVKGSYSAAYVYYLGQAASGK